MSWTAETNIKGPKGDTGGIGEAPTDGQTYGRQNAAWNIVVSGGGAASSITFTPAGNIAATNVQAAIAEVDTEKVAKAGDTMTGNLQINKSNPSLVLQKTAAGQANQLAGYNGANPRWSLALGDSSAEGGSNAGSNFALYRYTDAGGLIDTPLTIARTTGGVTLTGPLLLAADPGVALGAATKQYVDGKAGGSAVYVSDTPPVGVPDNSLWWQSSIGLLYIRYNDGDSTQWTMAVPLADATRYAVRYDTAQTLTAAQKNQARANIDSLKKNYVVNGAMMINQEAIASTGASQAHAADQWVNYTANAGTWAFAQNATSTPAGSPYRLSFQCVTADASIGAADQAIISQVIEGFRVADLQWGTTAAKTITIQFGVRAPAGTYCLAVVNGPTQNRSYVAEYVIAAGEANTDVVKSVTIPGDIGGTWSKDSNVGMYVQWILMAGSNLVTTPNAWATGSKVATTNQYNFMQTSTPPNNVFYLFDVGLYEGTVAPTFQVPDYVSELVLCMRYYEKFMVTLQSPAASSLQVPYSFKMVKRAIPIVATVTAPTLSNATVSIPSGITTDVVNLAITATVIGGYATGWVISANARL
jgi:hypothetical protein